MTQLIIGAVAYDPKVVTIWEGMRAYFRGEARLPAEVVLYLSYEAQVDALLAGKIDVAWNTNLAFVQATAWSEGACTAIAMRDTDIDWRTHIIALRGGSVRSLSDLRSRRLALGSRDSGHAAILPAHFLGKEGLSPADYEALRFDTDLGKHGDTGTSEVDVLKAVLEGRADAGAVGSPFWAGVLEKKLVPDSSVDVIWTSPSYHHCMFTARAGLEPGRVLALQNALFAMKWNNPRHRPVLEAEGLKEWVPPSAEGYVTLQEAARAQGLLRRDALREPGLPQQPTAG